MIIYARVPVGISVFRVAAYLNTNTPAAAAAGTPKPSPTPSPTFVAWLLVTASASAQDGPENPAAHVQLLGAVQFPPFRHPFAQTGSEQSAPLHDEVQ